MTAFLVIYLIGSLLAAFLGHKILKLDKDLDNSNYDYLMAYAALPLLSWAGITSVAFASIGIFNKQ